MYRKEPAKNASSTGQQLPQIEHQRRSRTENGRQHVDYQPENGASRRISMRKNDGHRVQPVAEIVRDYAERNQESYRRAHLKADADCDAVQKAVKGETGRRHRAKLRLMSADH